MLGLLLLAIALIVYGSLYPWHFNFSRGLLNPLPVWSGSWPHFIDRWFLRDTAVNLLLYVPLGIAAFLGFARRQSRLLAAAGAVALGAALSTLMELLQLYDPGRTSSLYDVACNTLGCSAGVAVGALFGPRLAQMAARKGKGKAGRHAVSAVFLLCCWFGYQLYPGFPALNRSRLWAAVAALFSTGISPVAAWSSAAEWFAAGLLLQAIAGPLRARWLLLAMAAIPVRLLVAGRRLELSELCGAAMALALWTALSARARARGGPILLISAIVLSGIAPFHFSRDAAEFSWVPFLASLESSRQPAALVLFRKTFAYGAVLWLLRRAGWNWSRAGVALGALLAVIEWAQRYLPGRTPESTDPLLALMLAFVLWALDRQRAPAEMQRKAPGK